VVFLLVAVVLLPCYVISPLESLYLDICSKVYIVITLIWPFIVSDCPHSFSTGRSKYLLEDFSFKGINFVIVAYVSPKIAGFLSRHEFSQGK
jgi:hypothetical protein